MEPEAEQRALDDVRSRLQQRFPHVDSAIIEAAVRSAHTELTGRVRDFVPVLVEHVARDRLSILTVDAPRQPDPA